MITSVHVLNFRNYEELRENLYPGVNAVIGSNGKGKTNLLEALFFMLKKRSFRTNDAGEMVRKGEKIAVVEGRLYLGREIRVRMAIEENGSVTPGQYSEEIETVAFQPDDIWMIKGGPEERRRALDEVISGVSRSYRGTTREYQRVVRQRNEALKGARKGKNKGAARSWNPLLIEKGTAIVSERKKMLARLQEEMGRQSGKWGKGELEIKYYTNLSAADGASPEERLMRMEEAEIRRGTTLIGPHRDELVLLLGGRKLRRECSQGEQKLATIMWRLAQARMLAQDTGKEVVLLMDDCLSELDAANRALVLEEMSEWPQVVFTHTEEAGIPRDCARIFLDREEGEEGG